LSFRRARHSKGEAEQEAKAPEPQPTLVAEEGEGARARGGVVPGEDTPLRKASSFKLKRKLGWPKIFRQIKMGYTELVNAVIRPPRAAYGPGELGPKAFQIGGRRFQRDDLRVPGGRDRMLVCSWWQPEKEERLAEQLPCVVYMHGNASCRLEALDCLQPILHMGLTLFAFDFSGCGQSDGETITLGYREKDDAQAIVEYLRKSGSVSTIAFWGRSMGAATALLHGHRDPSIAAMVLDSPFSSLEGLAHEIVDRAELRHKPKMLVNAGIKLLRWSIRRRTGLDILRLRPIENVNKCFIPAIFVAGEDDKFIPPHHTTDIFQQYAGDKDLIMVRGGHNSPRPPTFMHNVSMFFYYTLCVPAGLTDARPALETPWPAPRPRLASPEQARHLIRAELQRSAGESEAQHLSGAIAAVADSVSRLVNTATSRTQSTLPDQRRAADDVRPLDVQLDVGGQQAH